MGTDISGQRGASDEDERSESLLFNVLSVFVMNDAGCAYPRNVRGECVMWMPVEAATDLGEQARLITGFRISNLIDLGLDTPYVSGVTNSATCSSNATGDACRRHQHVGSAEMYPSQSPGSRLFAAFNARLSFLTPRASHRAQRESAMLLIHLRK